jgi:hypothetical protein
MMTVALILATSTAPHAANVAVEAVTPSDIRNVKMEATLPPSPPACLDENGNYVDSWVAFSQNEDYQYYWHENAAGFVKSPYRTNQTVDGGIMRTVAQLYAEDLDMNNIAYALYNVSKCFIPVLSRCYRRILIFYLSLDCRMILLVLTQPPVRLLIAKVWSF